MPEYFQPIHLNREEARVKAMRSPRWNDCIILGVHDALVATNQHDKLDAFETMLRGLKQKNIIPNLGQLKMWVQNNNLDIDVEQAGFETFCRREQIIITEK